MKKTTTKMGREWGEREREDEHPFIGGKEDGIHVF